MSEQTQGRCVTYALPPAWAELTENVNGRTVFGQRGVRDPEAPCGMFDPVEEIDWLGVRITAPGDGTCSADGHYLCRGCRHLDVDAWEANHDA